MNKQGETPSESLLYFVTIAGLNLLPPVYIYSFTASGMVYKTLVAAS